MTKQPEPRPLTFFGEPLVPVGPNSVNSYRCDSVHLSKYGDGLWIVLSWYVRTQTQSNDPHEALRLMEDVYRCTAARLADIAGGWVEGLDDDA